MKTCPNCGSVLADNEPYCENCGFDPDFDMGSWSRGSAKKPYCHGDHIKKSDMYTFGEEADTIICIAIWVITAVIIAIIYLYS